MPTKAEIEMAKALLVLVSGCIHQTGSNAYRHVDLEAIQALSIEEPDDAE